MDEYDILFVCFFIFYFFNVTIQHAAYMNIFWIIQVTARGMLEI
jgi:hypothetical protein